LLQDLVGLRPTEQLNNRTGEQTRREIKKAQLLTWYSAFYCSKLESLYDGQGTSKTFDRGVEEKFRCENIFAIVFLPII